MAEFGWWLLIVGIVAGGALTWLVLAESTRRERELSDEEMAAEAAWIARTLDSETVDADAAEAVLRAHRRYLGFPPPDALVDPVELSSLEGQGIVAVPPDEGPEWSPVRGPHDEEHEEREEREAPEERV